jgi:hypothetical protein
MPNQTKLTMLRGTGVLTVTAAVAAMAIGCGAGGLWGSGSSGTPPPPPTTATVSVTTSFAASGASMCTVNAISWLATPVMVPTKGDGTATAVTAQDKNLSFFPSGDRCKLDHTFSSLRPGTWRITITSGEACESSFPAGTKFVSFEGPGSTCKVQ